MKTNDPVSTVAVTKAQIAGKIQTRAHGAESRDMFTNQSRFMPDRNMLPNKQHAINWYITPELLLKGKEWKLASTIC
jgi:hypothetical protein